MRFCQQYIREYQEINFQVKYTSIRQGALQVKINNNAL